MRLKPREKRVVVLGLVGAFAIVGWMYVVSPMQERWKRVTDRLETRESELANLRRAAQGRGDYGVMREKIMSMVFETPELGASQRVIPALINQVESYGQRQRIRITRYEPLPVKIEENYAIYSLNLAFQSDLKGLVQFLKEIQEARPLISIRRAHITPPGPNAETPDFTVELLLSTFGIEHPAEPEEGVETTSTGGADTG